MTARTAWDACHGYQSLGSVVRGGRLKNETLIQTASRTKRKSALCINPGRILARAGRT
jgi:hypothetical protein